MLYCLSISMIGQGELSLDLESRIHINNRT
jgi:hypothetical protein